MEECKRKHTNKLPGEGIVLSLSGKKLLERGDTVYLRGLCGCFLRVKINGKPKTWRRMLNQGLVRVPFKYGLYEHGYIDENTEVRVPAVGDEAITPAKKKHSNWEN